MDQLRAVIELDQQVLAASMAGADNVSGNQARKIFRDGPAHARFMHDHSFERVTCCNGVNSPSSCFDFW
jgi:hypothetical protein